MLGFITTSLKLTQPSTSMEKSRSQAYKGAGVDQEEEKEKEKPDGNLDRLSIELEDASVV